LSGFSERMEERARGARSRLVVALDFYNIANVRSHVERALELLEALAPYACAFKLNHHLLLPHGLQGLRKLTSRAEELGVPLIADIKLSDVGVTNKFVAELLASHGISALIASPLPGRLEGLAPLQEVKQATGLGLLVLAYMSHRGAEEVFARKLANGRPLYHLFVAMAKELGADGLIVGATRPERIREVRRLAPGLHIYSPGIGPQGGSLEEAIRAGADYIIVGRQLLEGPRLMGRAQEMAERTYALAERRA
jgi:orotidine-5'-phosphate decarboxylase